MSAFFKKFFNSEARRLDELRNIVADVNSKEKDLMALDDAALRAMTDEFRKRLRSGRTPDDILPEAFAVAREASRRTLGQRHYDVQILGGIVLHQGHITEMRTGEGKTLAATLPAYLNALSEKGVHIVTVNDYLSRRDTVWMGQIYHFLGLTVACINHDQSYVYDPEYKSQKPEVKSQYDKTTSNNDEDDGERDEERDITGGFKVVESYLRPCSRREAYRADITYGTNNEFGFDYLRDNIAYDTQHLAQRPADAGGLHFVIIDEVDSILIDEARTPLIISSPDQTPGELYRTFSSIAPRLKKEDDYTVDEKMRAVSITEAGIEKVESSLGVRDIYTEKGMTYVHHLEQALRAEALFERDRDYVLKNGEVIIVDEFTGRLMPGRRWSDGLHQAIEAKEGVAIQQESRTVATITFQNLFRMYEKIAGMTGTAASSAEEFAKVYGLEVIVIPTHRPNIRKDLSARAYQTQRGKYAAAVREIKERAAKGQPVLVGTASIEKNELLSALLQKEGIRHEMLNAKNHEREAHIIAQAGRKSAVTVATNMAGRGVDIVLGGNPPDIKEAEEVREAGGLFVLGTERHEARRIDNQLRGRSGRQGDPGATQFYTSLEDDLFRIFGPDRIKNMMGSFGVPEDQPIEHRLVSRAIEAAQKKIEGFHFDARKHILDYDDVMNRQRTAIYRRRAEILFGDAAYVLEKVDTLVRSELAALAAAHTGAEEEDQKEFLAALGARLPMDAHTATALIGRIKEAGKDAAVLEKTLVNTWGELFIKRQDMLGKEDFARLARQLLLQTMDMIWVDHLEAMEHTRASVRLRAYGQHDPLVEYKNESTRLFREFDSRVRSHIAQFILRVGPQLHVAAGNLQEVHESPGRFGGNGTPVRQSSSLSSPATPIAKKVGRNNPCPCGSGEKYKRCHGK